MRTFIDGLYRLLQWLVTLLVILLVIPVTLQIISRFTDWIPRYIWTEEAARFCFIWIIMLGSMIAVRDGTHFDLDVLPHAKTERGQATMRMIRHGLMLLFALTFVWFGYGFALFGFSQESELTEINMLVIYIAWPLAGIAYSVFLLEKLIDDWTSLKRSAHE